MFDKIQMILMMKTSIPNNRIFRLNNKKKKIREEDIVTGKVKLAWDAQTPCILLNRF